MGVSSAIRTDHGVVWPVDPRDPKTVDTSLYAGTPGVVLFFLDAYHATGDASYLKTACAGADSLLAALPAEKGTGLYEGAAGIGFVLEEAYKASKIPEYQQGALQCLKTIQDTGIRERRESACGCFASTGSTTAKKSNSGFRIPPSSMTIQPAWINPIGARRQRFPVFMKMLRDAD